jgi:hypothetical protein
MWVTTRGSGNPGAAGFSFGPGNFFFEKFFTAEKFCEKNSVPGPLKYFLSRDSWVHKIVFLLRGQ